MSGKERFRLTGYQCTSLRYPVPMRLVGVLSQAALFVGLVIGEVALEPHRLGLALEREDMG